MKAADPSTSMGAKELERREIELAIQNSVQSQQEIGVTNASGQHFRRATQEDYPVDQWALTRTSEILSDPEPIDRKREGDAPAFLKPTVSEHYLAPLITILHAIPIAREALLETSILLPSYGQNDEWWNG